MGLFTSFTNGSARALGARGAGNINATGGTVAVYGQYRVHTFTSSGALTISSGRGAIEYVVVAGGGAGGSASILGSGGGGGAGGVKIGTQLVGPGTYTVTIGAGGTVVDNTNSYGGSASIVSGPGFSVTTTGGGAGAPFYDGVSIVSANGQSGGSGGGGSGGNSVSTHGNGVSGEGSRGGNTPGEGTFVIGYKVPSTGQTDGGAGGGGKGGVGADGGSGANESTSDGGAGGAGYALTWLGGTIWLAGGGGGAFGYGGNEPGGAGGSGVGGRGASYSDSTSSIPSDRHGTVNTGSGGGGGSINHIAGSGGSGVVYMRYLI